MFYKNFRVLEIKMVGTQCVALLQCNPVRIAPCMKLHASFVALLNHKLERIPKWFRSLSLHTGKISAPRLYIRFIKCICSWPYLENHSITTGHLERIQSMQKPLLYLLHIHSCYSLVANYMKPRPTKLIFWKFASLFASCTIDREYKQEQNH